jgi:hypothetical protein
MESDRWDETWHRLREWTNGQAPSERLAAQILISAGFEGMDPSHPLGGRDGGKDALCTYNGDKWVMAVYFPRGEMKISEIKSKLHADVLAASQHNPVGVAFVTNQELTLGERKHLRDIVSPYSLDIFHLERITAILDSPQMAGVRKQFLRIESMDSAPILEVQFYEQVSRKPLGIKIDLQSVAYDRQYFIPDLEDTSPNSYYGAALYRSSMEALNPSYMRDKEQYERSKALLQTAFLGIRNTSTQLAEEVTLEIEGSLTPSFEVAEDLPQQPVRRRIDKIMVNIRSPWRNSRIAPNIETYDDQFRIKIHFGTIKPGQILVMDEPIFLGAKVPEKLLMNTRVFANNLSFPIEFALGIDFEVISMPPLDIDFLRQ